MIIRQEPNICLEMAKLRQDKANPIYGDIGKYIYFSQCLDSHGPRVKFYGGTTETGNTRNSPWLRFDKDGNTEVEVAAWMNKKNCPNAFDEEYVAKVAKFVITNLPILLLVWFEKLDEDDALDYFKGILDWSTTLTKIDFDSVDIALEKIKTMKDLDNICRKFNLYEF